MTSPSDWHLGFVESHAVCLESGPQYKAAPALMLWIAKGPKKPGKYVLRLLELDRSNFLTPYSNKDDKRENATSPDDLLLELTVKVTPGGQMEYVGEKRPAQHLQEWGELHDSGKSLSREPLHPIVFDLALGIGKGGTLLKDIPIRCDRLEKGGEPGRFWEIGVAIVRKDGKNHDVYPHAVTYIAKPRFQSKHFERLAQERSRFEKLLTELSDLLQGPITVAVWLARISFCKQMQSLAKAPETSETVAKCCKENAFQEELALIEKKISRVQELTEKANDSLKAVIDALGAAGFALDVKKLSAAGQNAKRDALLARAIQGFSLFPNGREYLRKRVLPASKSAADPNGIPDFLWSDCLRDMVKRRHDEKPLSEDQENLQHELDSQVATIAADSPQQWEDVEVQTYFRAQGLGSVPLVNAQEHFRKLHREASFSERLEKGISPFKHGAKLARWAGESYEKGYKGLMNSKWPIGKHLAFWEGLPAGPSQKPMLEDGLKAARLALEHKWMERIHWLNTAIALAVLCEKPQQPDAWTDFGSSLAFLMESVFHAEHYHMGVKWAGTIGALVGMGAGVYKIYKGFSAKEGTNWSYVAMGTAAVAGYGALVYIAWTGTVAPPAALIAVVALGTYYVWNYLYSTKEKEEKIQIQVRETDEEKIVRRVRSWIRFCAPAFLDQIRPGERAIDSGTGKPFEIERGFENRCVAVPQHDGELYFNCSQEKRPTREAFYNAPASSQMTYFQEWIAPNLTALADILDYAYAKFHPKVDRSAPKLDLDPNKGCKENPGACTPIGDYGKYTLFGKAYIGNNLAREGEVRAQAPNGSLVAVSSIGVDGGYMLKTFDGVFGYVTLSLLVYDGSEVLRHVTHVKLQGHPKVQVKEEPAPNDSVSRIGFLELDLRS